MTGLKTVILDKISRCEAVVGVIGLGYVGLPLAVEMAETAVAAECRKGEYRWQNL